MTSITINMLITFTEKKNHFEKRVLISKASEKC